MVKPKGLAYLARMDNSWDPTDDITINPGFRTLQAECHWRGRQTAIWAEVVAPGVRGRMGEVMKRGLQGCCLLVTATP